MLIKINAIVREEKFEDVKEALNKIGVNGITVSQVMGCGAQKGFTEVIRGTKVDTMEERGIVGPQDGSKPRQVLITEDEFQQMSIMEE